MWNSQTVQVCCTRIGEELDRTNTVNSTNDYDTRKYAVDVLGRAIISKTYTYRSFPESRNHPHPISFLLLPFFVSFEMSLFPFSDNFCTIIVFSLYGEYVVRFFLPG